MRHAILTAAAEEFADVGFEGAKLADIAQRAGTSIGNLYKYFTSKEEIFAAAVPREVALELGALLRRRVKAIGVERAVDGLPPGHPYQVASDDLLQFALAYRPQILFLLRHAEGSGYASFSEGLVQSLTNLALEYAGQAYPAARITVAGRRTLVRVYRAFLASIASMLAEETTTRALRETTRIFTRYHLAGLRALFETAQKAHGEE